MTEKERSEALELFTKDQLIKMFPSLEFKSADKKGSIIDAILGGEPATEETENFMEALAEKNKPAEPEKPAELKPKPVFYIVVHEIREDGELYKPGSEYAGKHAERFLTGGQIRKR